MIMKRILLFGILSLCCSMPCLSQNRFTSPNRFSNGQSQSSPFSGMSLDLPTENLSYLRNSMRQVENMANGAVAAQAELGKMINQYADKLNNDEKTMAWFADFREKMMAPVVRLMDSGYYGDAQRMAYTQMSKVTSDCTLRAMVRTTEEYAEIKQRIMARTDITEVQKINWLKNNPYNIRLVYDSEGNVIGGNLDVSLDVE